MEKEEMPFLSSLRRGGHQREPTRGEDQPGARGKRKETNPSLELVSWKKKRSAKEAP